MANPPLEFTDLDQKELSREKGADFSVDEKIDWPKQGVYNEYYKPRKSVPPKLIFTALIVIALFTLSYGFYSLSANIYKSNNIAVQKQEEQTTAQSDSLVDSLTIQQNTDSDKDGLTDYEELNVYGTSPYLADTDSDGYDDKKEIDGKHDPLCPKVDDCRVDWPGKSATSFGGDLGNNTADNTENFLNDLGATNDLSQTSTGESTGLSEEAKQQLNSLTADDVRFLLKESGQITEEQLNQIDDETLMKIYKEALSAE